MMYNTEYKEFYKTSARIHQLYTRLERLSSKKRYLRGKTGSAGENSTVSVDRSIYSIAIRYRLIVKIISEIVQIEGIISAFEKASITEESMKEIEYSQFIYKKIEESESYLLGQKTNESGVDTGKGIEHQIDSILVIVKQLVNALYQKDDESSRIHIEVGYRSPESIRLMTQRILEIGKSNNINKIQKIIQQLEYSITLILL